MAELYINIKKPIPNKGLEVETIVYDGSGKPLEKRLWGENEEIEDFIKHIRSAKYDYVRLSLPPLRDDKLDKENEHWFRFTFDDGSKLLIGGPSGATTIPIESHGNALHFKCSNEKIDDVIAYVK